MIRNLRSMSCLVTGSLVLALVAGLASSETTVPEPVGGEGNPTPAQLRETARQQFFTANPDVRTVERAGRTIRVVGPSFSTGETAKDSADSFVARHIRMFGVEPADLAPIGPFADGHHEQPIAWDPQTETFRLTGVYYSQMRDGIPVFRSRAILAVRNEPGYPLVHISADLRDIGTYHPGTVGAGSASSAKQAARRAALKASPGVNTFTAPRRVIFAGVEDQVVAPVLADEFIASGTDPATGFLTRWLFVTNAATGAILHQEDIIHEVDVTGNVSGMATQGIAADSCAQSPEVSTPIPYGRVAIGATVAFADVNGNFTIPNAGSSQVTVNSTIRGPYFRVFNQNASGNASLNLNVTPPGPANFMHNSANTSEFNRAEVNAYIHANRTRDIGMAANPAFPTLPNMTEFPVNVNINQNCNAFYDPFGVSINFYVAGGGCTNTANSTVASHEFGHHLVAAGSTGTGIQGGYGEGMGDCIAICSMDTSCLGQGFQNCGTCLREANNMIQYPYNQSAHEAGRLISGCVWSLRNELASTNPGSYLTILRSLTINSILLHTGTGIDPSITVDFLTVDDDNGDIFDGTPHYPEIATAFGAHNMDAPTLNPIKFFYPGGRPPFINPSGGTTMQVHVQPLSGTPVQNTGVLHLNTGSGFVNIPMTQTAANQYEVTFPASACGTLATYYVSAQATNTQTYNSPGNAPSATYVAASATGAGPTVFSDNFQTAQAWTVSNSGITSGAWVRGVPADDGADGDPTSDGDGSGQCYVTDNGVGNFDVDGGTTRLISPTMDATINQPVIAYWRWYSNTAGAAPMADTFVVEISSNNGTNWTTLETVGPTGAEVDGGWFHKEFSLGSVPGFALTNQFKIRFSASDLGSGSLIEAAVDGVELKTFICTPTNIPGDVDGDGDVDIDDYTAVVLQWDTTCPCTADLDGDGDVDIDDYTEVILNWT